MFNLQTALLLMSYYVFEYKIGLQKFTFYFSFYMSSLTFVSTLAGFVILALSIRTRFMYVNDLFAQIGNDKPENVKIISVPQTPIIQFNEIFNIYGRSSTDKSKKKSMPLFKKTNSIPQLKNRDINSWIMKHNKEKSQLTFWRQVIDYFTKSSVKRLTLNKNMPAIELKEHITRLMHLHNKLCDAVQLLNDTYSYKLLIAVTFTFVYTVFALFSVYR